MTAQSLIDSTKPLLSQTQISGEDGILLTYLNFAKNQIAQDTLSWLGGEEITMTTDSVYTLSVMPIQIIDMYDSQLNIMERNSYNTNGYFQISPTEIKINNPVEGNKIYINYYYTPNDYELSDEVTVPLTLQNAIQYFIAHKSFETYRSEKEIFSSTEYYKKYKASVTEYLYTTDTLSTDSLVKVDMIKNKCLV